MPEMGGLEATRVLTADEPDTGVVVVTASEDDADLYKEIKSGAQGFIPKNLEASGSFELLDGVTRDEPELTPGLARKVLRELAKPETPREERTATSLT